MCDSEPHTIVHEHFTDLDDYIDRLKGWDNDISQLMSGPWLASQSTISAGEYQYLFFSHSVKSLHRAHQNQQGFNFLVPLSAEPYSCLAYDMQAPIISCAPYGQQLSVISPADFQGASLFISYECFDFLLEHRYDSLAHSPSRDDMSFFKPSGLQLSQLTKALIYIRETFEGEHVISPEKQQWLHWFSEAAVAPILMAIIANETNQKIKPRPAIFTRAVDMVLDNLDSSPTVTELSQALGISPRYLQQLFQKAVNLSPKQFIGRCRLNRARQQFSAIRYQRGNIADVANRLGYWHMSGFTQDFRRLFGVTPSKFIASNRALRGHEELEFD